MFTKIISRLVAIVSVLFFVQPLSFCEIVIDPSQIGKHLEEIATNSPESGRGVGLDIVFRVADERALEVIMEQIIEHAQNTRAKEIVSYKEIIETNGGFMTGYYEDEFSFKRSSSGHTKERKLSMTELSNLDYAMSPNGIIAIDMKAHMVVRCATRRKQIFDGEITHDTYLDRVEIRLGNAINASISDKNPFLGDRRNSLMVFRLQERGKQAGFEQRIQSPLEVGWEDDNLAFSLVLEKFEDVLVPSSIRQESHSPMGRVEWEYFIYQSISGFPFPLLSLEKIYTFLPDGNIDFIRCSLQINTEFSFEEIGDEDFMTSLDSGYKVFDYRSGGEYPDVYESN